MECSLGWLQVLLRFCPAIRHWPDLDSCECFCAGSAEADRRIMVNTIVTIVGSDQFSRPKLCNLQAFIGFCLLILVKNLVAPAFESEIQKGGFPYVLRRKYAHNPEDDFEPIDCHIDSQKNSLRLLLEHLPSLTNCNCAADEESYAPV